MSDFLQGLLIEEEGWGGINIWNWKYSANFVFANTICKGKLLHVKSLIHISPNSCFFFRGLCKEIVSMAAELEHKYPSSASGYLSWQTRCLSLSVKVGLFPGYLASSQKEDTGS